MVGSLDDVGVVLDDIHGVAHFHHLLEQVDEVAYVFEVKAVGGFVNDKYATCAPSFEGHGVLLEAGCHLQALQFATREGAQRLVEMQIVQADVHHGFQFFLDDSALEEFAGTAHRQVHDLGDILAVDGIFQSFTRVAQAVTSLAGRLDVVHESHLGDDYALAAAHGATALTIEGEILLLDFVGLGKALADVGGYVHIGRGSGAQTHADVFLADIHDVAVLTTETLHQRTLARTSHTSHGSEDAHGQVDVDILEVVQGGVAQREGLLYLARLGLEVAVLAEHLSCARATVQQFLIVALKDDVATLAARSGSQVHNVVGNTNHFAMVLNEQYGIARITQAAHRVLHLLDVVVVEARAGLVQDIEHVGERRIDVFGNLATLSLTARQGAHCTFQAEVAQPDFLERCESRTDGLLDVHSQRCRESLDPLVEAGDGHGTGIGDIDAVNLAR